MPAASLPPVHSAYPIRPQKEGIGASLHTVGRLLLLNEMETPSPRREQPGDSL